MLETVLVFVIILVVSYFILRRFIDRETSRNLFFLGKIVLAILGLIILFVFFIFLTQQ